MAPIISLPQLSRHDQYRTMRLSGSGRVAAFWQTIRILLFLALGELLFYKAPAPLASMLGMDKENMKICNYIFYVLMLSFFILFAPANSYSKNDANKYTLLIMGTWVDGFPFPAGHNAIFVFNVDNTFIHKQISEKENKYMIVEGKWKLELSKLYVKTTIDDWILISDLRSFNEYWFPDGIEKGYPPAISTKFFQNKKITSFVKQYYKITNIKK